ncbi:methylmalonyl Co-A mutase-associated GTPase MeaB [Pelagihabitans pacificus]|uniref:methylmalonyl Co-A mutase-associated GTPase MeaB n=1 Tax=Pelagihabitans pacificus TaxID=2696054 RepID=UPI001EE8549A|nr:methylmalonyl Co-A mutase-associated GTPase MeaB [Pelagihabitans pacificus]
MSTRKNTDRFNISKVKESRKPLLSEEDLFNGIRNGNKAVLAQAITLVESSKKSHWERANTLVEKCLAAKTRSIRIGITGVPGVGKSTFIETLGKNLTDRGKKVVVLAVDPTSSRNKGSIMGDKTRMPELSKDARAFVRPSPSGDSLGGVARKTRETIILCEAAGYDIIMVETVGVGQSETAVHGMVDFFLLLKLAGAGDELQGIKRGIIEMADAIVINKADGDNLKRAKLAEVDFKRALQLYPPKENGWIPTVSSCSATENRGIHELWEIIEDYVAKAQKSGHFSIKRKIQNKEWLLQTIEERLKFDFYNHEAIKSQLEVFLSKVAENKISPFRAAEALLELQRRKSV